MARPRKITEVEQSLTHRFLVTTEDGHRRIDPKLDASGKLQTREGKIVGHAMLRGERRRIARVVRNNASKGVRRRIDPVANLAFLADQERRHAEEALAYVQLIGDQLDELTQRKTLADFQSSPVGVS